MGKINMQIKNRRDFHKKRRADKRTKQEAHMEVDQFLEYIENNYWEIEKSNIGRKRFTSYFPPF
ncbi:hypothetical protein E9993_22425 [Labilibacter sediminis]|nr:hypothetical protein E9993_22425 [Labilibacter sediminis]